MKDDSSSVLAMDFVSHKVDTIARYGGATRVFTPDGTTRQSSHVALFNFADQVTVTSDGTLAIFHAREFRVEWIGASHAVLPAARVTYPWRPITEADRARLVDSVNRPRRAAYDSAIAARLADSARTGQPPMRTVPAGVGGAPARQVVVQPPPPPSLAVPEEMPAYYPANPNGTNVLADAENHVWVRVVASSPDPGFDEWYVVSRTEGLIDRVRVPDSKRIAGFAPGFVFLTARDGADFLLEKLRLR
jgi:hypothetical protein